jgi:predicted unusual protein kinase regulating ubiquinone biosynthesis (AarF/ABC1/UbiB family)
VLAGSGKEVVIKVVKPGTADIITADLNAVSRAGWVAAGPRAAGAKGGKTG